MSREGASGSSRCMPASRVDRAMPIRVLRHGRRAVEQNTTYVAFDTSKETIAVALAEGRRRGEVRFFGTVANRPEAVRRLVDKLAGRHSRLAFCYEAGPTGYGLYRQIRALGHDCQVVAPSMVPVRPAISRPTGATRRRTDRDLGS